MASKIYNSIGTKKKNHALTVAIVLGAVTVVLVSFIVWCAFSFSGDGYKNTVREVSELKMQLTEKDTQISELKEQLVKLEEKNKQLEKSLSEAPATYPLQTSSPAPKQ